MGASVYRINATGAAAVATAATVPVGQCYRLVSVAAHFSAAPVTAGSLTVTLDAADGGDYDTLLQTVSMVGLTDFVWIPDQDFCLVGSDAVRVAYANPDNRIYGVRITLKAV
jgi:hypothetical protein